VVDDDKSVLAALDKRLSHAGFAVAIATNGMDALSYARSHRVDAITLDVSMPGPLDGLSLAAALRKQPQTSRVPIIFVTGVADEKFKERCKQGGGEYFVCKPYDDDLLIRLLQSVLGEDALDEMRRISQAKRRQPV
jgi:chemosensory pili system protein ChpA (sensor histidine kinase/response regulator)